MLPFVDSSFDRGCSTLSDWMVIECVPTRIALSETVREEEKLTGGRGPLLETAGSIECRLLDDILMYLVVAAPARDEF